MQRIKDLVITYQVHIILVVITAVIAFQGAYIMSLQAQIKLTERVTAGEVMDYNQNVNIQQINAFINNAIQNAKNQTVGNANQSNPQSDSTTDNTNQTN
jgi:preprotein translocase subunit SecF